MGLVGAAYPYSDSVIALMQEKIPTLCVRDLLGIWYDTDNSAIVRCAFMDAVTNEYAKNFSGRIGAWCQAHGVYYAGHIVEDMNAHTATWRSVGHYFRSQVGQDLAGVDVVLHQIKTYSTNRITIGKVFGGLADPTFYLHTLPALAVSDAWLDEKKRGSVCELFGAFGWSESIQDMKWMLDVMLAAGIDHFIPHAFCPETGNDDCPPHFYENGTNPLYHPFASLMAYLNDILNLTGKHTQPKVGVLYHAESEWSGKSFHLSDDVCRTLNERQIPFIITPWEKIPVSGVETLIVPYCEYLPPWIERALADAKKSGVNVVFEAEVDYEQLKNAYHGKLQIVGNARGVRILDCDNPFIFQTEETGIIHFKTDEGSYVLYDPMNGTKTPVSAQFSVHLEQGETRILLKETAPAVHYETMVDVPKTYALEKIENGIFVRIDEQATHGSINARLPDYSGCVRYSCELGIPETGDYEWRFSAIGGALELFIDGVSQGYRFCAPAVYRKTELPAGKHKITYAFYNTLANVKRDFLSYFKGIENFGLLETPSIRKYRLE
jgi:hypothetical protein